MIIESFQELGILILSLTTLLTSLTITLEEWKLSTRQERK